MPIRLLHKKKAVIVAASIMLGISLIILFFPGQFGRALGVGRGEQSAWPDQDLGLIMKNIGGTLIEIKK